MVAHRGELSCQRQLDVVTAVLKKLDGRMEDDIFIDVNSSETRSLLRAQSQSVLSRAYFSAHLLQSACCHFVCIYARK